MGDRSLLIRERTLRPLESYLGRRFKSSYRRERFSCMTHLVGLAKFTLPSFEQKYEPWLGIEASTPMSPFLISVRCLIAARHLPAHRRLTVIPPLHLCREHAMSFILSSTPNLASIQALHILSTWEPIESLTSAGQRMEVQNGGALIAAAIAHASVLRLDATAEFVHSCSESKDVPEDVRFKANMVSRCNDPVKHQTLMKAVAQPVCFRVHVNRIEFLFSKGH